MGKVLLSFGHGYSARALARLLRGLPCKINLIPFNAFEGISFAQPDDAVVERFTGILQNQRYVTIVRDSKGQDISAACGQLAAVSEDRKQKTEDG